MIDSYQNLSSTQPPDEDLVIRAVSGNVEAFGTLYDRYVDLIYNYVYYRVNEVREAEDVTETVFLKAFENLTGFNKDRQIENFRAWIYKIAHNQVIDYYRTNRETSELPPELTNGHANELPEPRFELRERSANLLRIVHRLKPTYRDVILNRFFNGLSHRETAQVMDLEENHIRILQYRALRKIREVLQNEKAL